MASIVVKLTEAAKEALKKAGVDFTKNRASVVKQDDTVLTVKIGGVEVEATVEVKDLAYTARTMQFGEDGVASLRTKVSGLKTVSKSCSHSEPCIPNQKRIY